MSTSYSPSTPRTTRRTFLTSCRRTDCNQHLLAAASSRRADMGWHVPQADTLRGSGLGSPESTPDSRTPSPESLTHPHHRHPIRLECPIRREDREPFVQRLHDEQAVERVAVVARQVTQQVPVT